MFKGDLRQICIDALIKSYKRHQKLGKDGLKELTKNFAGETSLVADWDAEEAVIETLRNHKVPITIVSEEHGTVRLGSEFTGVLDGLDGTNRYEAFISGDRTARYGTMFAIFEGTNPIYGNYIFSGIMEHPTGRLITASRDKGIHLIDPSTGKSKLVESDLRTELDPKRIRADTGSKAKHFPFVVDAYIKKLPELHLLSDNISLRSSAAHYADFALGEADWVFECTRKHNLEIAVAYGLVRERGGVMVSLDGKDIGNQRYFEFHYDPEDYVVVISAPNLQAAKTVIKRLK
ncbi:MAG: hypothetical protein HYW22_00950 [Candidatus Aenigmarchaeota archaeon]|nr:hypothetical protein [Candidatus Aenigmarchaeota archaeon]